MKQTTNELLRQYGRIMNELYNRNVIRTFNNPIGDFAEWLVSDKMKFTLENNSKSGHDAVDKKNIRYQIKCRRLQDKKASTQLGVIRNYELKDFEYLIGVLFNSDFSVKKAYQIPHEIISKYAKFSKHQNGYILYLKGELLKDKKVRDITNKLK